MTARGAPQSKPRRPQPWSNLDDVPVFPTPPFPPLILTEPSTRPLRHIPPAHPLRGFPTGQRWKCELLKYPAASPRLVEGGVVRKGEAVKDGEAHQAPKTALELQAKQIEARYRCPEEGEGELRCKAKEEESVWVVVKRYWREDLGDEERRKGVTAILENANGIPKECYEPMLGQLVADESTDPDKRIVEIWSIDGVRMGHSGLINRDVLGPFYDWSEKPRDLLQFMFRYLPSLPSATSLSQVSQQPTGPTTLPLVGVNDPVIPLHLPLTSNSSLRSRIIKHLSSRQLLLIGHSFSATALIRLISSPIFHDLFSPRNPLSTDASQVFPEDPLLGPNASDASRAGRIANSTLAKGRVAVILIDPVLRSPETSKNEAWGTFLVTGALKRQKKFESREKAKQAWSKAKFFQRWDNEVLDLYVEFGLLDKAGGGGEVELTTRRQDEAIIFGDPYANNLRRSFILLSQIPRSLPVHLIAADRQGGAFGSVMDPVTHASAEKLLLIAGQKASWTTFEGTAHMIPMEKPAETAKEVRTVLDGWWTSETEQDESDKVKSRL